MPFVNFIPRPSKTQNEVNKSPAKHPTWLGGSSKNIPLGSKFAILGQEETLSGLVLRISWSPWKSTTYLAGKHTTHYLAKWFPVQGQDEICWLLIDEHHQIYSTWDKKLLEGSPKWKKDAKISAHQRWSVCFLLQHAANRMFQYQLQTCCENQAMRSSTDWWKIRRRERGKVAWSKLWLNPPQIVNLCRLLGKVTRSKLWFNVAPKVKLFRLLGKVTRSKFWWKQCPKVRLCRLLGKVTKSKLWLKWCPMVKCVRLLGRWYKLSTEMLPISVTPSSAISSSEQDNVAAFPTMSCSCNVWWRSGGEARWWSTSLDPLLDGCSETKRCTNCGQGWNDQGSARNLHHSDISRQAQSVQIQHHQA